MCRVWEACLSVIEWWRPVGLPHIQPGEMSPAQLLGTRDDLREQSLHRAAVGDRSTRQSLGMAPSSPSSRDYHHVPPVWNRP